MVFGSSGETSGVVRKDWYSAKRGAKRRQRAEQLARSGQRLNVRKTWQAVQIWESMKETKVDATVLELLGWVDLGRPGESPGIVDGRSASASETHRAPLGYTC